MISQRSFAIAKKLKRNWLKQNLFMKSVASLNKLGSIKSDIAVKKAYQWIAAYIPELTDVEATRNIEFHDMSKNTPDEYKPYDDYFYGEQTPAVIEAFNRAWLMHIHRNPHHWQHWVLINDEPKEGTILIEMPYPYIIEMVCDWWAFSWIKGDLSEMFAWYKDHEAYIKLHNNTRSIVEEILEMIRTKLTEVENAEN